MRADPLRLIDASLELLALSFPYRDPQFWIVTAVFAAALLWLLRNVLPIPWVRARRGRGRRRRTQRATLTVSGKPVQKQ